MSHVSQQVYKMPAKLESAIRW